MTKQSIGNGSPVEAARIAFGYDAKQTVYKGAAQQAMAFSLLRIHEQFSELQAMGTNGMRCFANAPLEQNMPLPTWEAIRKGGEAGANFLKAAKLYLDVSQRKAEAGESRKQNMARIDDNAVMKKRETLIVNSIKLAAALHAKAIPLDCFKEHKVDGVEVFMWSVPMGCFIRAENEVVARPFNNETMRLLNGKSLPLESANSDGTDTIAIRRVASIDAFVESVFPPVQQSTPATPATTTPADAPAAPTDKPGAYDVQQANVKLTGNKISDFNALVLELSRTIESWEDDEGKDKLEYPPLSDIPANVQSALAHIAAFYDTVTHAAHENVAAQQAKAA